MSIDAVIGSVEQDGEDYILRLIPRLGDDGTPSVTGQDALRLRRPVVVPKPDAVVWGDSGSVRIVAGGGAMEYRRVGYTEIVESGRPSIVDGGNDFSPR